MATKMSYDFASCADAILKRCQASSSQTAFIYREPARWREVSWNEVLQRLRGIAGGLATYELSKGERVAILGNTRVEWAYAEYASQVYGLVTVPIYQSNLAHEVEFILKNSGSVGIFVENREQLEKVKSVWQNCPNLRFAVVLDSSVTQVQHLGFTIYGLQEFEKKNPLEVQALAQRTSQVQLNDLMTLIYTSGTTGMPKGVMLPHRCFVHMMAAVKTLNVTPTDRSLTFLPFAHVFGRIEMYLPIFYASQMWFAQNLNTVSDDLAVSHPTVLLSVPRIYEKVYAKIVGNVKDGSPVKQKLFQWAVKVGLRYSECKEKHASVPLSVATQYALAHKLVFSKITAKFGGRLRFAVSGGAPLAKDLARFFHACGILILEGYGLTETTGPLSVNQADDFRFGCVGKVLEGLELKIAEDGEILIRGPSVCDGYFANEEATKEAFTKDGWFCTGDIGELRNGFLAITDRKKDIIVTSAGKNVAPQYIENLLKMEPLVSQVLVVGDRQKYIAALVTLDQQKVEDFARKHHIGATNYSEIVKHDLVQSIVSENVKRVNAQLPSYETIKKFHVLPQDFTIESGELTPSLKVKRKVCAQKFKNEIASLYSN